jgi:hypothetical protein
MQPINVELVKPKIGETVHVRSTVDESGDAQYWYAYYSGEDFFYRLPDGSDRKLWFEVEQWVYAGEGFSVY